LRQHFYHLVIYLLLFSLPVVAADQDPQKVIAKGYAGSLTVDAFDAYYEALVFCLGEIGQPSDFSDTQKQQMMQLMVNGFPTLPAETQQALGLNTGSSGGGTGSDMGVNVPWSEGYSKSYGGGVDAGDGTYEVETYDSSTGSYGYSYE
jgi:hypothetical protein